MGRSKNINLNYEDFLHNISAKDLRIYLQEMTNNYNYAVAEGDLHNMAIYKKWKEDAEAEEERRLKARLNYLNKKQAR